MSLAQSHLGDSGQFIGMYPHGLASPDGLLIEVMGQRLRSLSGC